MKKLPLKNPSFRYLEQSFSEWLDILGYAPTTVYGLPIHVRELLVYLEQQEIKNINQLETYHIKDYYGQLSSRTNQTRGGGLSSNHLNKHIQAIRKFCDYLRQVGRIELSALTLKNEKLEDRKPEYLNQEEIHWLFKSTQKEYPRNSRTSEEFIATLKARDRAMLAIYYGCGARRTEGTTINVSDINFDRAVLHIKKGKRYKERLVPISKQSLKYLQEWIYDYRPQWLGTRKTDTLFISERGTKLSGQTLLLRLKILQELTENNELIEKEIGLHTLRHSIATHLLQAGMKLESISRFLGHSSLESTQIYTHLAQETDLSVHEYR